MRVLVVFEENYRLYRDSIVGIIRVLRPHVECSVAEVDELEEQLVRLAPHLVIGNLPKNAVDVDYRPAWLELLVSYERAPARLCLDGQDSEVDNPGLNELLWIVDETER